MLSPLTTGVPDVGTHGTRNCVLAQGVVGHSFNPEAERPTLAAIAGGIDRDGWAPTVRELAAALGWARTHTHNTIARLVAAGMLDRRPGTARALRLTATGWAMLDGTNDTAADGEAA